MSTNGKIKPTAVVDKWDFWVFSLSARGRLYGEQSRKSYNLNGNASVSRVTPDSRFRLGVSSNVDESRFDYEDYQESSSSKSTQHRRALGPEPGRALVGRGLRQLHPLHLQQHQPRVQPGPGDRV